MLEGYERATPLGAAADRAVRAERRVALPAGCGSRPPRCADRRGGRGSDCAQAVTDAAELLRSLGHEVVEVEPPWRIDGLQELFGAVFSNHIALSIAYAGTVAGREPPRRTWSR